MHDDAHSSNSALNAARIVFPGLDQMLFTRRQRQEISRLKMHDDFREEGIWYRIVIVICMVVFLLFMAAILFAFSDKTSGYYGMFTGYVLPLILLISSGRGLLLFRHGGWFLPTIGCVVDGEIASARHHRITYAPRWDFEYKYKDNNSQVHLGVITLQNFHFGGSVPKVGDKVYVFYDPLNADSANLFIPYTFKRLCVSRSRYYQMKSLPFLRGDV